MISAYKYWKGLGGKQLVSPLKARLTLLHVFSTPFHSLEDINLFENFLGEMKFFLEKISQIFGVGGLLRNFKYCVSRS